MTGVIAPLVFVAAVVAQGMLHSDYSHMVLPISALAAWPHGWVQSLNFLVLGSGVLAFATTMYVLASGVAVLVLFLITMLLARTEGAPLHAGLGLLQRLVLVVWLPCMIALSWRAIRTSGDGGSSLSRHAMHVNPRIPSH